MARHLSTKQLTSWLNGETDQSEHDGHLDSCSICAARLEEINLDNVEAISAEFRPALLTLLQPPADLHDRISERIAERLQARDDASLFGSLLGVPVETSQLIIEPNIPED